MVCGTSPPHAPGSGGGVASLLASSPAAAAVAAAGTWSVNGTRAILRSGPFALFLADLLPLTVTLALAAVTPVGRRVDGEDGSGRQGGQQSEREKILFHWGESPLMTLPGEGQTAHQGKSIVFSVTSRLGAACVRAGAARLALRTAQDPHPRAFTGGPFYPRDHRARADGPRCRAV